MEAETQKADVQTQQVVKSSPSHLVILFLIILGVAALSALGTYYYLLPQLKSNTPQTTVQYQQVSDKSNSDTNNTQQVTPVSGNTQGVEGWITFQDHCGISYQYPKSWKVDGDQKGYDTTLCSIFTSPDIKSQAGSVVSGQYMTISRIGFNAILYGKSTNIHSLEDYIKFMQAQITPSFVVADKSIGNITGKYYNYPSKASSDFAFEHGDYIYVAQWLKDYSGIYSKDTEKIISTLKFTN